MKHTTRILSLFTLLCAAIASLQIVHAATITVTNTNDGGSGSLRQALADANDGDTIDFDSSLHGRTITLTSGQLVVNKSVTISGLGAANLAVDGNAADRVFYVSPGKTVTISGLTIAHGSANEGGGIYNEGATLTVNNCIVSGNSAGGGGGGGGIYNYGLGYGSATLTVNNSTLSGNSASSGGGIMNIWMAVTVTDSTFSGNSAFGSGGGIYNNGEGYGANPTLNVNNSTFSGNSALGYGGGGIYNDAFYGRATVTVNNSTFSGNSALAVGGGIWNDGLYGSATVTVNNSTLSRNSALGVGGGIYNSGSELGSATLTLGDTILNDGSSGANIYNELGAVTSLGYNLSNDDGGGSLTAIGDQMNTDPMLGPLQDNGGPTFTHALLPGSPAVDAGDPNFTPPPDYDQRGPGFSRVVNGRIDIGAFEAQTVTPSYAGQIQAPINADGTSIFNVRRGVIPVKFTLTQGGVATCDLPPATIAVTRTGGGVTGQVNESVYTGNADTGSNFRIDNCQYVYNLNSRALGVGFYRVDILTNGQVVGSAVFQLE